MDEETLIGYHGTKKELVSSICTNNFNINKDINNKLYLGFGIYFFYESDDALDWNVKSFVKEFSVLPKWDIFIDKFSIIKSEINLSQDDILDLDKKENLKKIEILIEKLENKLVMSQEYSRAPNKTAAILNMLYKRKLTSKKVISKTFFEKINTKHLHSLKNYPRKMFCVKDNSIILKNKEKLDTDENAFESIIYFYK